MRIFQELRERRLFQIALSYAGIGWAILEVTDQLADRAIVPEIVYKLVLIWVLLGIPATVLIGWHHGEKGKQKAPLSEIIAIVVLVLIASGLTFSTVSRERALQDFATAAENPLEMRRLAVMYFRDDSPGGEYQYLADGLTEDLIAELSQVPSLSVVSRNGSLQFRGSDAPPDSIARVLGAGTLVDGSVEQRGQRLRVSIALREGQSGQVFKRVGFDMDPAELIGVRDSVSVETARLLREWLREEVRARQSASSTRNTAAWGLLQRAEKTRKDAEVAVAAGDSDTALQLFEAADSLLAQAQEMDRSWAEPPVARAAIAYRRSRLVQGTPPAAMEFVRAGLELTEEALRRSNTAARAYEMRGTFNYFTWLLRVTTDPAEHEALLQSARADLEMAVRFDPLLASAHATLSHLYTQDDVSSAVVAAQKAYDADAYLEVADLVLFRLFTGSQDLGNFTSARRWCDEGRRRFPEDYRFVQCELRQMITPGVDRPDVDLAWRLLARQEEFVPEPRRAYERARAEMMVAGAIARAARTGSPALQDSARAVLDRARAQVTPQLDPVGDLLGVEAYIRVLLGEKERAVGLLQQQLAANPLLFSRTRGEVSWWWRDLQDQPRFREMVGL
jgi:TolB-like protein